jgi:hypothetical protein
MLMMKDMKLFQENDDLWDFVCFERDDGNVVTYFLLVGNESMVFEEK